MTKSALHLTLVALSCVPAGMAHAQAPATPASVELHVGGIFGAAYTDLHNENVDGWGLDARPELRLYEPGGFGAVLRPILRLGSPNLLGGELGGAYQGVLAELPSALTVVAGGAVGISIAQRFYVGGVGLGSIPAGGVADQDHTVVGYFAEVHLELRLRNGVYFGLAATHHGFLFDTHPEERGHLFSITPSLRVGRAFDL
jgi:hypothetical protein